jgi:uncharacterized protein YqhQ
MDYIDIEGTADSNGISFEGDQFEVEGYYKKNKVKLKIEEYEDKEWNEYTLLEKLEDKMGDVKFLRGLTDLLSLTTILPILLYLYLNVFNNYPIYFTYLIYLSPSLVDILYTKFTNIGRYHSAEHMAINAYENGIKLTVDNLKNQKRYHSLCGTNFSMLTDLIMIIGMVFNLNFVIMILIARSFSHEIVDYLDDHKRKFSFIHTILSFFQVSLYTAKPQNRHLELAATTLKKLIKLESK